MKLIFHYFTQRLNWSELLTTWFQRFVIHSFLLKQIYTFFFRFLNNQLSSFITQNF